MRETPELLAPAGNDAALHAAVQSGADAVYLGGMKFGARHSAKNFTTEDIRKACEYCHLYGVDVHAAVNTLIKENELGTLIDYVYELNDAGVDALIIQDIGAARLIRRALPDMALHASTQMTVTSLEGVKYLEEMGFSRIVLARELSKNEISRICAGASAEIEVFVHGAICMCYSGQCLMSSILGGRSGNRGRCAQPCRLPYSLTDGARRTESAYILSPRDMALIKHLNELKEIGVSSLKIEGRLKRAEYVSAVVGIYRKYLDSGGNITKEDMRELHDAFSRCGFTDGYFTSNLGKAMMSHKNPGNEGNIFTSQAKARAAEGANIRKIPISISASAHIGSPVEVSVFDDFGHAASAIGESPVEAAASKPTGEERFKTQLARTGATPFIPKEIYTDIDPNAAVSVKEINNARRTALYELAKLRSQRDVGKRILLEPIKKASVKDIYPIKYSAEVRTLEQGAAVLKKGIDLVYAPYPVAAELKKRYPNSEIVMRAEDIFTPEKPMEAIAVSSNAAKRFYEKRCKRLYGTHRLNIFNSAALENYKGFELVSISPELRLSEIKELSQNTDVPFEVIAYGRLPLMLMRNCPIRAMGVCQKHSKYSLKDRRAEEFPIICHSGCIAELLNSKPIFMADKLQDLASTGAKRLKLIFTVEPPDKCAGIVDIYNAALTGSITKMRENTFTRGHYYRAVQ